MLGLAEIAFHVIFRKLRIAAECLHSVERDLEKSFRGEELGLRHIGIGRLTARQLVSRVIDHQPRRRQLGLIIGHPVLEHLIRGELLAERVALAQIFFGVIKRRSRIANLRGRNTEPLQIEMFADIVPALADFAEQSVLGQTHLVHEEFGRAQALANKRLHLLDVQSRRRVGDEEQREAVIAFLAGAGEDGDGGPGQLGTGTPDLVPVEDPFVPFEPRGRAATRSVRARLRLTDRDRKFGFAAQEWRKVPLDLRRRAMAANIGDGKHRCHDASGGIEAIFAYRFAEYCEHDRVGCHAALVLRNQQAKPA